MRYELHVSVNASPEKIQEVITNIESIKIWEPSHRLPLVSHNWIPDKGKLQVGNLLIIKSLLWTFKAECKEITKDTVIWEFKEVPLKGNEYWKIDSQDEKCRIMKIMDCRIYGFMDKILWQTIGRKIHDWASVRQLETIKNMAEKSLSFDIIDKNSKGVQNADCKV